MFIIDLLFSKKADHVAMEAEVRCPDVAQTDAAEDDLFYGPNPPPNLLLVRVAPTMLRVCSLDYDAEWNAFFEKLTSDRATAEETIRAHTPRFAQIDFLHIQPNGLLATVRCDVATFAELDVKETELS